MKTARMRVRGTIARLQLQRSSLKVGPAQQRRYDPSPVLPVSQLVVRPSGVTGWDETGSPLLDVHNAEHPHSKNSNGRNGISILFTPHYTAMRARFGAHLTDGIAGESVLVETEDQVRAGDLRDGLMIATRDGTELFLGRVEVAEPCVEFTRYALRLPADARSDRAVTEALKFLRSGMRGFYAGYDGQPAAIHLGDAVLW